MTEPTLYRTRCPEIGYIRVCAGLWRFVDITGPAGSRSVVGPCYASKAELLADLSGYLARAGWEV